MRRRGRFVDAIWVRQRMDAHDVRVERELQRRRPRQLQPEVWPVVEVTIVRAPNSPDGPVVEVVLTPIPKDGAQ